MAAFEFTGVHGTVYSYDDQTPAIIKMVNPKGLKWVLPLKDAEHLVKIVRRRAHIVTKRAELRCLVTEALEINGGA